MPAIIILLDYALLGGAFLVTAAVLRRAGVRAVGRYPVPPAVFWLGKTALVVPVAILGVRAVEALLGGGAPAPRFAWPAAALATAGAVLTSLAFRDLGLATRTGLPVEATQLRTAGIYRLSRNPMYLGLAMLLLAAVVYAPGPWTVGGAVVAATVHHRIVLSEERDLAVRFGAAYARYRARTRRYL